MATWSPQLGVEGGTCVGCRPGPAGGGLGAGQADSGLGTWGAGVWGGARGGSEAPGCYSASQSPAPLGPAGQPQQTAHATAWMNFEHVILGDRGQTRETPCRRVCFL